MTARLFALSQIKTKAAGAHLEHELRDHAVEGAALIVQRLARLAGALLACAARETERMDEACASRRDTPRQTGTGLRDLCPGAARVHTQPKALLRAGELEARKDGPKPGLEQ